MGESQRSEVIGSDLSEQGPAAVMRLADTSKTALCYLEDESTASGMDPVETLSEGDIEPTGIVPQMGELGDGAVIFEEGLALLFKRHPASIKRAVERGELPRSVRLFGRPAWTAGAIRRHFEARLAAAERDAQKTRERVTRLRS